MLMILSELIKKNNLKTVIILFSVAVLYTLRRYLGSTDFFIFYLNRSSFFTDAQASAQYYNWGLSFVLFCLVPVAIVKLWFREKLGDYGVLIKKPLISIFITLLGIVVVTPAIYIGSKMPEFISIYPVVYNAGETPLLFLKSSVFYFLFYIGYEFIFRGFLFMGIKEDIGMWKALSVSLLATVLIHVTKPMTEMTLSILIGLIFPIIVNRLKSIWPVIIIHAYIGIAFDYWVIINGF